MGRRSAGPQFAAAQWPSLPKLMARSAANRYYVGAQADLARLILCPVLVNVRGSPVARLAG
jgi:hypothetical protein